MKNSFDIIKVLSDDSLAWLEAAEELSAAKLRICELLADSPGEYIVYNQETKTLVSHFTVAPETPQLLGLGDDYVPTPASIDDKTTERRLRTELHDDFLERPQAAMAHLDTARLYQIQPAMV